MANANTNLVKMGLDLAHGNVSGNYSLDEANAAFTAQLIEANNGLKTLDYKAMRDGKCNGLFSIMETILTKTISEGLPASNPMFNFVENIQVGYGDQQTFEVKEKGVYTVSEIANGTQQIRRQRVLGGTTVAIPTRMYAVKIYESLRRILAGRVVLSELVSDVNDSFTKQINETIYDEVVAGFGSIVTPYSDAGSFSADTLLNIVAHVEAANDGKTAMILGSRQAVGKITGIKGADANSAKEDLYAMGYFGRFGENPVVSMKNAHKPGTTDFILGNDLYVIAADDKFIKHVQEGEAIIVQGDPMTKDDFSQEYFIGMLNGVGCVMSMQNGVYRLS